MSETTENLSKSASVIEVERKFTITEDSERKLQEVGASCLQQKSFEDSYYDTDTYELTLKDHWLRQREGQWELKSPPEQRDTESKTAQYAESIATDEILQKLTAILKTNSTASDHYGENPDQLADFVKKHNLKAFAVFKTNRRSYRLDGGFQVDLDETDFGYRVGEIELVVGHDGDVAAALQKIDRLAEKLDFYNIEAAVPGNFSAEHFPLLGKEEALFQ
ncbi:thiamine-triphosphatase-like isoform X2 [Ptychodera flava]|uniref:thiamine-triphosphatase-like isoform X2 n=1 Tax=Ptychodera flava TaxID=63121 RepID=UPI00396A0015